MRIMTWRATCTRPYNLGVMLKLMGGRGLHSFTLELKLSNSRTHS